MGNQFHLFERLYGGNLWGSSLGAPNYTFLEKQSFSSGLAPELEKRFFSVGVPVPSMQFFWGQTSFRKILGQLPSSRSTSVPRKNLLLPHGQWEKSLLSAQPSVSCPINSIQSLIFKFLDHMSNSISTIPKLQGNMSSSVSGFLEVPSFLWLKEGGEYGSPPHMPIVTQLLTERTGIQEPWA